MIKYCCDMCGKSSGNEHDVITIRLPVPYDEDQSPFVENVQDFMLCRQCTVNVSAFVQGQALAMQGKGGEDNGKDEVVQENGHEAT